MGSKAAGYETHCARCAQSLSYDLIVNDGGGLRYEVSCPPCGQVYFEVSSPPLVRLPLAA